MFLKIDWISLTMPLVSSWQGSEEVAASETMLEAVAEFFTFEEIAEIFAGANEPRGGRTPYSHSWHFPETLVTLYANPNLPHILIEFTGQCCDIMRELGLMDKILEVSAERATRLDVAADIETDTMPVDFVAAGHSDRFKTTGEYKSQSGQTVYIGSQKSERFCRVYRYAEPHPRAKLLRVEYVMRRDHAKQIATAIAESGLAAAAKALGNAYGWQSLEIMQEGVEASEIAVERPEKARKNAVRWLITQVAPAFQRLVREGNIADAQSFLEEYFLKGI